ncbi:formimidoylglutamase [Algoriphagus sp. PAP.12]|uniref:formimidoylglutamase n=1 Tax=Algoriphagus sp. PAP.12 TaxID=2996678 RepID=UPI00227ADFC4|nr:formimidoylglutamase [Algoriphagus sp. PAP.12]
MSLHQNPNQEIWTGRKTSEPEYWYQFVQCISDFNFSSETGRKIGILGYPGEEGVKRNQGRPGAKEGPDLIRKFLAGTAFHLNDNSQILDYGDIVTSGNDLESTQQKISETVLDLLRNKHFPVLLGGGHDLAYAHGKGILQHLHPKGEKLGIINLDAHFDLRPLVNGKGHSGSPFYQLYEEFPDQFRYLALGIQRAANPQSLFNTAKNVNANYLVMEQFRLQNWEYIEEQIIWFLDSVNKVYLTIDLDGFASAFAPGVSAPSPMGFNPQIAFKVFELIAKSKKMISLDVVELNPRFDQDNATARLAARCIEYLLRKIFS